MTFLYPTASTVAVFINGMHVEQAYRVDWEDSVPKVPVYGYNDYEYTKVVRGKGIVQGMMVINFIFAGYLTNILKMDTSGYVPGLYNYGFIKEGDSQDQAYKRSLSKRLKNELPPNADENSRKARAEFIASLISREDGKIVEKTKETLYDFFDNTVESVITPQGPDDQQSVFQNSDGTVRTIENPLKVGDVVGAPNQIDIYYQDPSYVNWFVRLHNVSFLNDRQQISQAGAEGSSEPLYEIYSFIASRREIKVLN